MLILTDSVYGFAHAALDDSVSLTDIEREIERLFGRTPKRVPVQELEARWKEGGCVLYHADAAPSRFDDIVEGEPLAAWLLDNA